MPIAVSWLAAQDVGPGCGAADVLGGGADDVLGGGVGDLRGGGFGLDVDGRGAADVDDTGVEAGVPAGAGADVPRPPLVEVHPAIRPVTAMIATAPDATREPINCRSADRS